MDNEIIAQHWLEKGLSCLPEQNYDYAIYCFMSSIEYCPSKLDYHKKCYAVALTRGPVRIGLWTRWKNKPIKNEPLQSMIRTERLLMMDPQNLQYLGMMSRYAVTLKYHELSLWLIQLLDECSEKKGKVTTKQLSDIAHLYLDVARAVEEETPSMAIESYTRALLALEKERKLAPGYFPLTTEIRDVASQLTILKGHYATAQTFLQSVQDRPNQLIRHDQQKQTSKERFLELVRVGREAVRDHPHDRKVVMPLVDLLCRREEEEYEQEAIRYLEEIYRATGDYGFKSRADDIAIKIMRRQIGHGNNAKLIELELGVYRERMEHYPTDLRIKYEYARRLFDMGFYDEAVSMFQQARLDPKVKTLCDLKMAHCFYNLKYFDQAISVLQQTEHTSDERVRMEILYWLGRSFEESGDPKQALKQYGKLIELDYDYGDGEVRDRMEKLSAQKS